MEAVDSVGEPFDPNLHEAVLSEPSSDVPDQTVLEEFRKGFKLSERLLRPAMVKVSRKGSVTIRRCSGPSSTSLEIAVRGAFETQEMLQCSVHCL